jgi:hypothetical protein
MSPYVVTYIGFVVVALILIWAIIELSKRFSGRKKIDAESMDTWVTLKPTSANVTEEPPAMEDDLEEAPELNSRTKSQQNGHYSESKKSI